MSQREPTPLVRNPQASFFLALLCETDFFLLPLKHIRGPTKYLFSHRLLQTEGYICGIFQKKGVKTVFLYGYPLRSWYRRVQIIQCDLRKPDLVKQTHFLPVSRITRPLPLRRVGVGDKRRGCSHNLP